MASKMLSWRLCSRWHLLGVVDRDLTDLLSLDADVGLLAPARVNEVVGRIRLAVDGHGDLACVGVWPAGQEGVDQLPIDVLRGQAAPGENFVDPVEAVQLLRPFLKRSEKLFD
jgi:hypothetical protein